MTIQDTPKRSATMPKRGEKNVFASGSCTCPPLPSEVSTNRFRGRIGLHTALDRRGERLAAAPAGEVDANYEQAFRLLQAPTVRRASSISLIWR